ncbi:EutN/CcmL family microcompartment protein [bacterium]|nr:EutN/CcmL family microcompartment protein [bacterium]
MYIAKVVGTVWATRKHPGLVGSKMLLAQSYDPVQDKKTGKPLLVLDKHFGAGIGDIVLIIDEGGSARQILDNPDAPVRTVVIGVLDAALLSGQYYTFL